MKIIGSNLFSTGNTLPVEVLNLRDGQRIIGKVISASTDEALLEMAGHSFHAKIEGNPEVESGAVLKFLVNHDTQGRVLLKIINDDQPVNNSDKLDNLSQPTNAYKGIIAALTKEGLPASRENIDNCIRLLQGFENKYHQSLPPQVLAFIIAQKWPVNPETIMTAWLFQDNELRNTLWNLLRQSGSKQSGANLLAGLILNLSSKSEELPVELETLLKKIETIMRYLNKNENVPAESAREGQAPAKGSFNQSFLTDNPEISHLLRQSTTKPTSEAQFQQSSNRNQNPDPSYKVGNEQTPSQGVSTGIKPHFINEIKQLVLKLASVFEPKDLTEKIEVLLDRNMAFNKAILQEDSINGNYNLIPFLVNDSHNILHEVLIKWREEPGDGKRGRNEQILQLNIPTENLGEIHLYLRTGTNGSQITFKVENDSIRKYLLRNLIELKETVDRKNVTINVAALEPKESFTDSPVDGVDLWI